jgi:hypothetical protein
MGSVWDNVASMIFVPTANDFCVQFLFPSSVWIYVAQVMVSISYSAPLQKNFGKSAPPGKGCVESSASVRFGVARGKDGAAVPWED